jgi:FkbM family methyltransferase
MKKVLSKQLIQQAHDKYEYLTNQKHPIQDCDTSEEYPLVELGSTYGGWTLVDDRELNDSIILSAGLGKDASFDIEFINKYNSTVIFIDPTPEAIQHYNDIKSELGAGAQSEYTESGEQPVESYDLSSIHHSQIQLVQKALYDEQTNLDFFKPKNPEHISHSIVNWQHDYSTDTDSIEVRTTTVCSVINNFGVTADEIPLIKLDIEGAEVEVITHMLHEGILPEQILVEFDELHNPSKRAINRVDRTHQLLLNHNYDLLYSDGSADFLYYQSA